MMASVVMYQVLGNLQVAQDLRILPRLGQDLLGQEQPGALAAQAAVAVGRVDDPLHQVVKMADLDMVLGDIDEFEIIGKEAADQGDAQPLFHGRAKVRNCRRKYTGNG